MSLVMRVAYDGREFSGFQRQPGLRTVQGVLEAGLLQASGTSTCVTLGASRTDAGVHARGQVVAWSGHGWAIPPHRLSAAVNPCLPPTVRIVAAWTGPDGFDPARAARAKTYSYTIRPGPGHPDPWDEGQAWTPGGPLNLTALNRAARLFVGGHDFRAFRGEGSSARTTERTILAAHWQAEPPVWRFWVTGDGFLYHMVRFMVGSMIEAVRRESLDAIRSALLHPEGQKAAAPAPPEGLCLERVEF